ncbi:flavin reductase family protein [Bauldia sp.]|uniref:flavin reductase family protein n=1 Tax=Bauldia sp. TaxID=2575872 RepID=UPI003BAB978E
MNRPEIAHEIDPEHFRRVMGRFATGVTVITVAVDGGGAQGMTANAFMSGSLDPPLCVVSVARRARMHGHLTAARRFAINILSADQGDLANHFAGRKVPGLEVSFANIDDVPVLSTCAARIVADRDVRHDCGDHSLFVGHIRTMKTTDRSPLIYHAGHYTALAEEQGPETPMPEFW